MANPREMVQVPKVPVEMYPPQEICPTCGSLLRKGICPISCAPTEDMIGGITTRPEVRGSVPPFCALCADYTPHDATGKCTNCEKRREGQDEPSSCQT